MLILTQALGYAQFIHIILFKFPKTWQAQSDSLKIKKAEIGRIIFHTYIWLKFQSLH